MKNTRLQLWAAAMMAGAALVLSGCAAELPLPPSLPLPEPLQPEVTEPEVHSLTWYTDQVWAERQQVEDAQELISGCMAFNGFEYVPEVASGDTRSTENERQALERAKTDGYGLVSEFVSSQAETDAEPVMSGPNIEYFEELDADEQMQYLDALDGTAENGFEGCRSEAQLFTMSTDPSRVYQDAEFRDLLTALGALPDEISTDERTVKLETDWSACMSVKGLPEVAQRADMPELLRTELHTLVEPTPEQLEQFRTREIAIATSDMTCASELNWAETSTEIEADYHERFVTKHIEDLRALVAEYGI